MRVPLFVRELLHTLASQETHDLINISEHLCNK
jgi:hypothetical protein